MIPASARGGAGQFLLLFTATGDETGDDGLKCNKNTCYSSSYSPASGLLQSRRNAWVTLDFSRVPSDPCVSMGDLSFFVVSVAKGPL